MAEQPEGVGKEVLYEIVDDHVALVTLNRPDKRNAVNGIVARAMQWIRRDVEVRDAIRVAIICSSSPQTFCAGADLAEIAAGRGHTIAPDGEGFAAFTDVAHAKPWIAAVSGNVLAGGCELALACDMIVASEDSRFGLPEVKRGLFAGAGGVFRLPRMIPRNIAYELVATGDPMPAERAFHFGLVNRLVPSGEAISSARGLAREIAVNAPVSVRESLAVARLSHDIDEEALRARSREASAITGATQDAKEGTLAFLEKRAPAWTGR
ncbi:MAG: enoyl-CoA hydratase/isomerase family protein [Sphingomonadaceae bacterium]|nr:enoyl-CoA hydratase/isomerase family protein [Sphingomonadaceae bacterium]